MEYFHTILGPIALLSGLATIFLKKGTPLHKRIGYGYAVSMLLLTGSSLTIYNMFDGWGPFHYMALVSIATIFAALIPAWRYRHRASWLVWHNKMMLWSYAGLIMATGSHVMGPFIQIIKALGLHGGWAAGLAMVTLWGIPMIIGAIWIERYNRKHIYGPAKMGAHIQKQSTAR
ncbi:MAG TPA: hypothetical protein DCR93_34820 [Cytophagales bacterium]|nr:hypothetical protein [Cytophagales bacterium]